MSGEDHPYVTYKKHFKNIYPTHIQEEEDILEIEEETPSKRKGVEESLKRENPDKGDKEAQAFNNFLSALKGLTKGQKEMVGLI